MMTKLFCVLTSGNQQFASSFNDRSEPRLYFTQDNDLPFRLYLLQSLNSQRWPFSYDSLSGADDITVIVSLRDIGTGAVLASTEPLTPVRNGFEGILHVNTQEVDNYLAIAYAPVCAAEFSADVVDAFGNKINLFRRAIILRAAPVGSTVVIPGSQYYFPEVTGYLGAGSTALQSKPTLNRQGAIFQAVINGLLVAWRIEPGTAETDLDAGIIKPADFDADTNPVNLIRVGGI